MKKNADAVRTGGRKNASKRAGATLTAAHHDKRREIMERCADLFDAGGYRNATMQMLADQVGLGKPTLYHYFRSKNEILFAIHQAHIDTLIRGLAEAQERGLSPPDLLEQACRDILEQIAEHPGYVRAFFEHYGELDGKMLAEIRSRRNKYFERICEILRTGMAEGIFRKSDVEITAYGFLGMCSWAYKWYPSMRGKMKPEELARSLCDTYLNGLIETPSQASRVQRRA